METASAVRRYRDEPVDDLTLEKCLQAASWAPSGANQQPWRFVVLRSERARALVTAAAHRTWRELQQFYGISLPEDDADDPKSRVLRAMAEHARVGGSAPGLVLFCVRPQAGASELQQGGSIFPAVQNFLLAARAQGLGAAITLWHTSCEEQLRSLVGIPDDWMLAALVTVGWPAGRHHSVRRKPLSEVAVVDNWGQPWPPRDPW
ncbi:nitroreductase [Mycobacterium sp. GA-1285]|uniref:nitroreductase family protein n=1 Tax=Mycobacterium sp. GA-1285 TaxID=1772282 RepID=UPI000747355D|nr:nitroreductase family protein [Mycobacterium sp. GA-1285]KUI22501.1 nitroreductase [Mycobacterium sp. GA-1285]